MANDLWYALQVRPRSEWMVAANLCNKGYELFLPTYKCKRRWSDRTKILELPLFPGYLFCQFDVQTRLPILMTLGVSSIVGAGKSPQPVDETEIDAIRTVVHSGLMYEPYAYLPVGQLVRVEHGSLCGLTGVVTNRKNDFRLIISITLLMRSVSVEIDRSWLKPIGNAPQGRFVLPEASVMTPVIPSSLQP